MFFYNTNVESTERYDMARFMAWDEGTFDFLNSLFLEQLPKIPYSGEFIIQSEERRPDLIAHKVYKDFRYWWIVMHYNNIVDHEALKTGLVLKLPALSQVEDLYFRLRGVEKAMQRSGAKLPTLVITSG